jgi:hypothetical protein
MMSEKRLADKQRALIMKQKPRRGRRYGSHNKTGLRGPNPTLADVRFAVLLLVEQGFSPSEACHAAKQQYGVEFTAKMVRDWQLNLYRKSLLAVTGN